jgi:Tfp pilus assembly protein PilX
MINLAISMKSGTGPRPQRIPCGRRRGVVLLAVVVALLVVVLISGALVRAMTLHRHRLRMERRQHQAFWFAESALQRAVTRFRATAGYSGETWRATAELDGVLQTGSAEIRVERQPDDSRRRSIVVEASWPDDPSDRVLEQRRLSLEITD